MANADGAKATLLLGMEQKLSGYQIGMPFLRTAEVAGPTTAPTVTPGSSGNVTGDGVSYKYSRLTIGRGETGCSSPSVPQVVSAKVVDLSGLVWSADAEVDALRVYRRIDDLGSDLITNGDFATVLTPWTGTNWAQAAAKALHTAGATAALSQDLTLVSGTTYQIIFTVSGRTAGTITPALGAVNGTAVSADGTYCQYITAAASGTVAITFTPTSAFDGNLDDISCKAIVTAGSWLHVGTVWDSTHVTTTFADNIAPGSEDSNEAKANETANNWGLREMPLDPGPVVKIDAVEVTPNELTGYLGEPDSIPIRVDHPIEWSASMRAGHLVPLIASHLGEPTVTRSATEPVWTYDFEPQDDADKAISLNLIAHLGGSATKPILVGGVRHSEIEIASPGNTELGVKAKGVGCWSSESSPGYPDSGNSGTNTLAPVLRGKRSDADAYTESVFRKITTAPSGGSFAQKFKVASAGTLGPSTTEYYSVSTGRVYRYGAQDEPSVEALVGAAGDPLGYDDDENREPVSCVSPGDVRLYALNDLWEFLPEIKIADSKVATGYSGESRIRTDQYRYTPARVRVLRGVSAANDYLEFTAATIKLSRSITVRPGHGPNAKRGRDLILAGYVKLEMGFTRFVESREFERYARGAQRLVWDIQIEGPRIWVNPGVRSTTRDLIRIQVPHGTVKSVYTVPNGPVTEALTIMAKQPADGSAVFTVQIKTGMGWDFTAIA